VCWASPVCCCAVLPACAFRAVDRGCRRHPAFPAPSWFQGETTEAKLGRNPPRGREAMSAATHALSSPGLTGRSSIPETFVIEPRSRSVLDSPLQCAIAHKAGNDSGGWAASDRLILRHCERSEAIQSLTAVGFWIASSQELLAMTTAEAVMRATSLSRPGRSAASLRRCAAEPGPISLRIPIAPNSASARQRPKRCSLSGTRERTTMIRLALSSGDDLITPATCRCRATQWGRRLTETNVGRNLWTSKPQVANLKVSK